MTAYQKGEAAFQEFLESGMLIDEENPFADASAAGENWQQGFDDAKISYLR